MPIFSRIAKNTISQMMCVHELNVKVLIITDCVAKHFILHAVDRDPSAFRLLIRMDICLFLLFTSCRYNDILCRSFLQNFSAKTTFLLHFVKSSLRWIGRIVYWCACVCVNDNKNLRYIWFERNVRGNSWMNDPNLLTFILQKNW